MTNEGHDAVVKVEGVNKIFKLPNEKKTSVKSIFLSIPRGLGGSSKQEALKNINFEVNKGEFFGIVGRNGSGKSTLLKIIAGIYQPTKGRVKVNGKLVPFIELGVGFNQELTGRENVYLNGALLGFSKKEINDQYQDIVDFAELNKFMDQKIKNYSSGMQVRLAFSVAVRAKSDILLIDEVLAVGDAAFQKKCFDYFNNLKKEKVTVIFVSHNMEAVREYCDRAMLVEDSKIISIGSTDKIAQQYMRLFLDTSTEQKLKEDDEDRWGDQKYKTIGVKVQMKSKSIFIHQTITAHEKLDLPVVAGFRIRDAAGRDVTGTNTKKERITLPNLDINQKVNLVWELPNILSEGSYTIDPALTYPDEITVIDWWNNATNFTIKKDRHLPYNIDPGFKLKVEIN